MAPSLRALWRRHQTAHAKSWRIDETYNSSQAVAGYLYRAIDSNEFDHGF